MSIFSADGTLLQIGKNPADNLPQISFDELADLKDANNKIDEAQVRKYQNKTDRPADPPWERTPDRAVRDNPRHGEWPLRTPIIDFTWHHLIPWEKLWGTWNGLAREKNWEMLKKLMTAFNITGGATKVQHMKQKALTDAEKDEIHLNLCWRKWNVVEGPLNTHRIAGDDPGEGFDKFTYGLTSEEVEQMKHLKNLYDVMVAFIDTHKQYMMDTLRKRADGKAPTPTDTGKLANLLGGIATEYKDSDAIMFRLEMWEIVTPGARGGPWGWGAKPTWRKARQEYTKQSLERDRNRLEGLFFP